jgi:rubrerythrin
MTARKGEPFMDAIQPKTPDEIMKEALVREKQAHDFYQQAAMHCKVQMVRELLEGLQNEESRHIKLIQNMLTKLQIG